VQYLAPTERAEILELLSARGDGATVMAGGTAVVLMLKQRLLVPDLLLSLGRVSGLDALRLEGGELCIGARVTHRALERSAVVRSLWPALADAYHRVASVRIRNVATAGGSLAHADPSQDPPVALMALHARVVLASRDAKREVPLHAFFRDYYETVRRPDELLTEIRLPAPATTAGASYVKLSPRSRDDYGTASAAAYIELDPATGACRCARIALGCVAPIVLRARAAEALLEGHTRAHDAAGEGTASFEALLREAGHAARAVTDPLTDARGSADYKRDMSAVMVRRAIARAWDAAARKLDGGTP
jgi:carbon-monoxide dehydrogenase medium subunit